ncbi:FAD-dependent oxidoreductase [Chitinophagales bacterium]|mgnify:CR=1 FL=1|nr:FAD-dependent oxidoreductase [Chitinophagales bacterium]|tara:strand:- start:11002 stop:12225 length:1224 start_codon:yes stop_codon:yes gene_type:complete
MKEHKIKKYFTLLLFTIFAVSILACNKDKNANNPGNNSGDFEGNVIIVGAGAAGLAAAKKLGEEGVSYQILEATEKWGGRIQKNVDFADFPIDLGAEWIHEDKSILNYIINQPGDEPSIETILYQPMDVYEVVNQTVSQISNQDMLDYYANYITEYKFKHTTWSDFIYDNFAQNVEQNIIYDSKVTSIDYSGENILITTENGTEYQTDKVIVTVSLGVLKSNAITFNPSLPAEKINAIQAVEFLPGFKLFMKFSDKFYPDITSIETSSGEKTYYDLAYGKNSQDHVLGLLSTGFSAEEFYALGDSTAIVNAVINELDTYFNGQASQYYLGSYIFADWGQQTYTQGTWTTDFEAASTNLTSSLNDKVYFAGETYNKQGISSVQGFYIIRGSVQSAILSGYEVVERILE